MSLSERARRFLSKRQAFRDCFMDPGGDLTKSGAMAIRALALRAGAYKTSFRVSPVTRQADALAMAYAEGRRDMYLYLQTMLKLPDEAILQAMEEES